MAITHSTGLRNYCLDSGFASAFDTNGRIDIYTGTQPSANAAATGTLLATLTLATDAFSAASGGAVTANTIADDTAADASGTAGYFMLYNSNETAPGSAATTSDKRLIGSITATGGGGDMTFDTVSFVAGGVVSITGFTYTYST